MMSSESNVDVTHEREQGQGSQLQDDEDAEKDICDALVTDSLQGTEELFTSCEANSVHGVCIMRKSDDTTTTNENVPKEEQQEAEEDMPRPVESRSAPDIISYNDSQFRLFEMDCSDDFGNDDVTVVDDQPPEEIPQPLVVVKSVKSRVPVLVSEMNCSGDAGDDGVSAVAAQDPVSKEAPAWPTVAKSVKRPAPVSVPGPSRDEPAPKRKFVTLELIQQCIPEDDDDVPLLRRKLKFALEYMQLQKNKTANLTRRFKEYCSHKDREEQEKACHLEMGRVYRAVFRERPSNPK